MIAAPLLAIVPLLATPNLPQGVKDHLALDYFPPCAVCHLNGITGLGTVNTPFGISMRARGLQAADINSLNTALDALQAEATDSDGDTSPDIAELVAQTDPNIAGGALALEPEYGCRVTRPGAQRGSGGGLILLAMSLALAAIRRRAYSSRYEATEART